MMRCICRVKDTILKAIHNKLFFNPNNTKAVFAASKIQFWKQFTTRQAKESCPMTLYLPRQRYNFESNSQRSSLTQTTPKGCICRVKDTILKAIHNDHQRTYPLIFAVFAASKIQFWKQFTTRPAKESCPMTLYLPRQRYNFESNSQRSSFTQMTPKGCICRVKDTILKAIHNYMNITSLTLLAVFAASKIQFWKQFTTWLELL